MKKKILKYLPILFLVAALTFMIVFSHEDELSDAEIDEFERLSNIDHTIDPRTEREEEFTSVFEGGTVSIYDADDNPVSEIPLDEWENNQEYYNKKFNLN